MKTIIIALFLLCSSLVYSQTWVEDTFSPGDTTVSFSVSNATGLFLIVRDSALTGTDTLWVGIKQAADGVDLYSPISLHELDQTTSTTFVTFPLIPGATSTQGYVWYPAYSGFGVEFTGVIHISRTNVNDNVTPYLPKTRFAYLIVK